MFEKTKVLIQLIFINLFLSDVFCDVSELKLPSTTANYDVTTANNFQNFNINPLNTKSDYSENSANSRISLYDNVNDTPENYQLTQNGPSPRLSISNGIISASYKMYPNSNQYNTNGCGLNPNFRCNPGIIGNVLYRNPYSPPLVQDRPILDANIGGYSGYNNQYQPNNIGTAIYTRPTYTGNLGQYIYNRPSVAEKPIYQYNGNLGQNVINQPSRCCTGGNIDQQVISRPSGCCYNGYNGNVGQNVINKPSYYPPNNDYVYNKPCTPCVQDDSVEINNGYYYPKPSYQVPTYLPPIYSTPQPIFPPATARISV